MNALELAERIGAPLLNNKIRHPGTGVLLAQFEGDQLVMTPEGEELAASLPAAPAKTTRARKPATVESVAVASDAVEISAPVEAPQADAPTE